MSRRFFSLFAALAALAACAFPAAAQDNTWVDRYHARIEQNLFGTVFWFDRFFEDDFREDAEDPAFSLRWTNDLRWDRREDFDYRTRVRARIRLPRMKGRLRLIISGENQGDSTAIRPEDPGNPGLAESSMDRRLSTELAYDLYKSRDTIVAPGAGVRISVHPSVFARVRLLHARELAYSVIGRVAVTPFWDSRDGFGESNLLEFEKPVGPETLLRWTNSATISENTVGWEWGTEVSVLRRLSPSSAVTFAVNASGQTRPSATVQNYRAYARYRRNIFRDWLFVEIEPDVNWPRRENGKHDTVPGGTVRLETNFTGTDARR